MPKAPRDKESTTPTKRSRKVAADSGNGMHAGNGNGNGDVAKTVVVSTEAASHRTVVSNLEEQIRRRAYELYMERGGHGGSPEQDWLRAQEEVQAQQRTV